MPRSGAEAAAARAALRAKYAPYADDPVHLAGGALLMVEPERVLKWGSLAAPDR